MYEIVVGRSESDRKKLGLKGTVFLGKHYVKMGPVTSLSNEVYMDVSRAHVILVAGKRGSGKSYTLGVIAEEVSDLDEEIKDKIAILIIDTMGIYWTMKYPNVKDEELLMEWGQEQRGLDITIFTPSGYYDKLKEEGVPTDYPFSIKPSELTAGDWAGVFGVSIFDEVGILIERSLTKLIEEKGLDYSLDDIIEIISKTKKVDAKIVMATENRFLAAKGWGLFDVNGTPLRDLIAGGQVSVLDISVYKDWAIKCLVVGIVSRKLMQERVAARKKEELIDIERGHSYFTSETKGIGEQVPLVWILIDEAHEFLPKVGKTASTDPLVTILREGRQPGVSLVLATQQPGEIHGDVITQTDIIISHRITARRDIDALNAMMQNYLSGDIQKILNQLPREKGSAVILDDNSEKLYPIKVKPRFTWHGGEAPTAIKSKGKSVEELGL